MEYKTSFGPIEKRQLVVDCSDRSIGRVAEQTARLLTEKDRKHAFPIHCNTWITVENISALKWYKEKAKRAIYKHSGYMGNMKTFQLIDILQRHPLYTFRRVLQSMLPRNKTRHTLLKRINIK